MDLRQYHVLPEVVNGELLNLDQKHLLHPLNQTGRSILQPRVYLHHENSSGLPSLFQLFIGQYKSRRLNQ